MPRLRPGERVHHQLPCRKHHRGAVQHPVEGQQGLHRQQIQPLEPREPGDHQQGRAEIADDEDQSHHHLAPADRDRQLQRRDPGDQREQEGGMQRRREDHAADIDVQPDEADPAELTEQRDAVAIMYDQRLHPALHPARALLEPGIEVDRRLLAGPAGNGAGFELQPRQPDAEIGVFGDIEGIPAADLAQC